MALQLPHSVFYHIPRTGGVWVREAIHRVGIPTSEIAGSDICGKESLREVRYAFFHASPHEVSLQDKFNFCFVRHPLTCYQSEWSFFMKRNWPGDGLFIRQVRSENFEEFVRKLIEYRPAYISQRYRLFESADFIGHYESLADDLVRALRMGGETFDEQLLCSAPPANTASRDPGLREKCQYPETLRKLVLEVEREAVEKYGYAEDPVILGQPVCIAE